jgi:hypothetical protein
MFAALIDLSPYEESLLQEPWACFISHSPVSGFQRGATNEKGDDGFGGEERRPGEFESHG